MADPPPDEDAFDPEEGDRQIRAFIDSTAALAGPPVATLARDVAALVAEAWAGIERRMEGVPNDKVLATMLLVGLQARGLDSDEPAQWQLHAASSLLSGLVGRRVPG